MDGEEEAERQRSTHDKLMRAGTKSAPEQTAQKAEREEAKGRKQTQKAEGSRKEK